MTTAVIDTSEALVRQARALLRAVSKRAAEQCRADVVEEIAASAQHLDDDVLTVVVCGEASRGKSSLINALLDRPGLLAATPEEPLAAPVAIRAPDGNSAEVARVGDTNGAECELDHPLLAGNLVLVDTPGVGGLERGHCEAALAALDLADAVLFVVDAGAPITAVELDFLMRASERVDAIIVALNRIDSAAGWREIRQEDEQLLASTFPAGCEPPIIPVSARMKNRADRLAAANGDGLELARDLGRDSGIPDLRRRLEAWAGGHAAALKAANLCRLGAMTVERLVALEHAVLESSSDSATELSARAQARRRQHKELGQLAKRKRVEVQDRFALLGRELEVRIGEVMSEVRRDFHERIASKRFKGFEEDLETGLMRSAETALAWLDERLAMVHDDLRTTFEPYELDPLPLDPTRPDRGPVVRTAPSQAGKVSLEEVLSRAPFVVAALALGNPFFAAATFAGLVMHRHMLGGRAQQEQHRGQLTETTSAFAGDLKLLLHEALTNARSSAVSALDELVAQRLADLAEEIRALDGLASRSTAERAARLQAAEARVARLDDLAGRLDSHRRSSIGALRAAFAAACEEQR